MTHQTDICKSAGGHVWETLPDGSRICFECDDRQQTDICQNRHRGNAESVAAFQTLLPGLSHRRRHVLALIQKAGLKGLTVHEAAELLGTTPNAVSGRFTELKREGLIFKNGKRPTPAGSSAGVYVTFSNGS